MDSLKAMTAEITRFAPSPSGLLHLGHAYAALFAAEAAGPEGCFLLRIEDLDQGRARPAYEAAIDRDLTWLGLDWPRPAIKQSARGPLYAEALVRLRDAGLLYPCFCTRAEIAAAGQAPQGPEGPLYPGTCRAIPSAEASARLDEGALPAWRLDVVRASDRCGRLTWYDREKGWQAAEPELLGDAVLARKDLGASYHLAVVLDDAEQRISLVTRGQDLFAATHMQRLLQALLDLAVPEWWHHRLITDETGKRLAKRDDARSLETLREAGWTPEGLRASLGL